MHARRLHGQAAAAAAAAEVPMPLQSRGAMCAYLYGASCMVWVLVCAVI